MRCQARELLSSHGDKNVNNDVESTR